MYYEEKCENGHWYWRGTPDGEWIKFSYAALEGKIAALLHGPAQSENDARP